MYGATMEEASGEILAETLAPVRRTGTLCGQKFRLPNDLEPVEIAFLICAFISIIGAAVLTLVRIGSFASDSADFAFAILLLVNLGFIAYYVLNGIFMERPYEVVVSLLAVIIVMLYCIAEYAIKGKGNDLKLGRLIGICIIGPVDIGLGIWAVKRYFEGPTGLMVKIVGGNMNLQSICKLYFIFSAFVKFDFQVVISMLIFMVTDGSVDEKDKIVIGIGVPFGFIWLLLGLIAARYEKIILSFLFLGLSWAEPAYIIYLFVKIGNDLNKNEQIDGSKSSELVSRDAAMMAAGVVGILVRIALVSLMVRVTMNFKRGLKERLDQEG